MNTQRKKIDIRFKTLIENGVISNHRSLFVVVGDKGRDQIPILYHIMAKAKIQANPDVLWAYKKELGFSSNRRKRMKQTNRKIKSGLKDIDDDDPFEVFVATTKIRYCYYKETHKILGNTFGMCIIQDFEAITPNILARTIETVTGGGLIVILLRSVKSLRQLFTMTMDVHARYRTESHQDVVGRFNERFILSLARCGNSLVIDDQLNILPISSNALNIKPLPPKSQDCKLSGDMVELQELKKNMMSNVDTQLPGSLISACATLDQAKAVLKMIDAILDKSLRSTVVMTAARGRGKSAALGLSMAAAVAYGYSNIFVTAPTPENLKTMFEYICKGFEALKYEEHQDYELVQSLNPDFNKALTRINIFRDHRQTIQYIQPTDSKMLAQAELLCIDEAAAIPMMHVSKLLGPYLVFMSSTVNGYEGTGRSLSLKLVEDLRKKSGSNRERGVDVCSVLKKLEQNAPNVKKTLSIGNQCLVEIELLSSIRYGAGDKIESWLTSLLCLNIGSDSTTQGKTGLTQDNRKLSCPYAGNCKLYYVNRDTLFSYHDKTEEFLQKLVSIFVSSHYKNSPDDLQMMSDAPAHHIFCLLAPEAKHSSNPEILCAVQVALEGEISKETITNCLKRGFRADGDMIPWMIEQEFCEREFASKSGARIVRIATSSEYQRMGYGIQTLKLLQSYYEGRMLNPSVDYDLLEQQQSKVNVSNLQFVNDGHDDELDELLLKEQLKPKEKLPPLLTSLDQRRPEKLDYMGVSYGITSNLLQFWKIIGMVPVYLSQNRNILTGEHSCIMLKVLNKISDDNDNGDNDINEHSILEKLEGNGVESKADSDWLAELFKDFRKRFVNLLSSNFRHWKASLALSTILNKAVDFDKDIATITMEELRIFVSQFDLQRLEKYAQNMADYRQVKDLLPSIASLYFQGRLKLNLNPIKMAVLLGVGLQGKSVEELCDDLDPNDRNFPASQVLAILNHIVKSFVQYIHEMQGDVSDSKDRLVGPREDQMQPVALSLDDELNEAAKKVDVVYKQKVASILNDVDLSEFAIKGQEDDWRKELTKGQRSIVSIKTHVLNKENKKRKKCDDDDDSFDTKKHRHRSDKKQGMYKRQFKQKKTF